MMCDCRHGWLIERGKAEELLAKLGLHV